ncbi:hypothetical protein F6476_13215 [Pseudomonas umsongensis]|uniref:hypothetical protein n=1 Tax=Pseudomonas umsongensis TaxID=198618 RepID=UPI0012452DC2|nr:hypothetical protein [Pseudomonas umsongensis]QFG30086.1 hypothetical protein F6476_13215 [Pseudomonas umsongensis]
MESKETLEQGFSTALGGFNELQNAFLNEALAQYSVRIKESISTGAGVITKQSLDIQQGFAAEAHHTGSYNIEAAGKGANNHRATMDVGQRNDPVTDIRINTPEGSKDYQLKFYKTGEDSATAFNHGKYENVGKIVPEEQLGEARKTAQRRANRNAKSRPEVSKNYKNTAEKLDDSIHSDDHPDIKSKPLSRKGEGSSEELVKEVKKEGKGPEYANKDRVRNEFNRMQYGNAAKVGAICGASLSAASELLGILRSDEPLTVEQCCEAAERIVLSSLKGAGNAVLVTGIQHLGQNLIDTASHTVLKNAGSHLVKGNVASAAANIAVNLGQNIYKFSRGEIDSLEFGGSMISTTVTVVGGSMAYSAGAATATFLGQWVASEIASTALLGTTLGALGPIVLGTVFSIGFSFAVSAYVGHFAGEGKKLAMQDMQDAMAKLNGGTINLSQYVGLVGTMADFKFEWKDMLPFSGSISVFSEYRTRKGQLMAIQKQIEAQIARLPGQEAEALYQLKAGYQQKILMIEQDYERQRQEITRQAGERYQMLSKDLNAHLEIHFLMFTPIKNTLLSQRKEVQAASTEERLKQARLDAYSEELKILQQSLEQTEAAGGDTDKIARTMLATVDTRLTQVLPHKTPWDQAYEFFVQP